MCVRPREDLKGVPAEGLHAQKANKKKCPYVIELMNDTPHWDFYAESAGEQGNVSACELNL